MSFEFSGSFQMCNASVKRFLKEKTIFLLSEWWAIFNWKSPQNYYWFLFSFQRKSHFSFWTWDFSPEIIIQIGIFNFLSHFVHLMDKNISVTTFYSFLIFDQGFNLVGWEFILVAHQTHWNAIRHQNSYYCCQHFNRTTSTKYEISHWYRMQKCNIPNSDLPMK